MIIMKDFVTCVIFMSKGDIFILYFIYTILIKINYLIILFKMCYYLREFINII